MILSLVYFTFVCVVLTYLFKLWGKFHRWKSTIDKIPGPDGVPLFGISLKFLTNRDNILKTGIGLIEPFTKKTPLVRTWFGPFPLIFITKADAARVMLNSTKEIDKAVFYKYLHSWIGQGLLTSTGSKWQHRRKLITPSFHFRILDNFLLVMNEQANILVDILKDKVKKSPNEPFDIYPYVTRCTLDILCETAMGKGVNAQKNHDSEYVNAVNNLGEILTYRMLKPWLAIDWIFRLSPEGRLEKKSLEIVHGFTKKIIKRKRAEMLESKAKNEVKTDFEDDIGRKRRVALLDMLLENSIMDTSNGPPLTDDDIREEVDTFTFEGHDTTSVGIAWALYCIGQHLDVQNKLLEELNRVLGDSNDEITSEKLHQMKYLDCVLKESLRLFPPVPVYGRQTKEEMDICGYKIPSGVMLMAFAFYLHRDPDFFPNPESFDPDRFLPENSQGRDPFAFIPFSAGPRNCIGQKYAIMEEKVVISQIVKNFKVTSSKFPDILSTVGSELVLRPLKGIPIKLEPR